LQQSNFLSLKDYKNNIYLELAKKITKYSWLIVYLTAASPVMDGSFFHDNDLGKSVLKNLASPRCSKIGYWNDFNPILEYDTLQSYIKSIETYIEQGQLKESTELYYPVRLKPKGENSLEHIKKFGVNHIELRMLDLNPLEFVGIRKDDLNFLHFFIIYLMSLRNEEFRPFEQIMAIKNEKRAAKYDENSILIETNWASSFNIQTIALHTLSYIEKFYKDLDCQQALETIRFQKKKILYPEERYAVQIRNKFQDNYVKQGLKLAQEYAYKIID